MSEGTQLRLAAIISTDIQAALRAHRSELIELKVSERGGRIGKTMGGGIGAGATGAR